MKTLHNQYQTYNGRDYSIAAVIEISRDLPVENIDIRVINKYHNLEGITSCDYDLEMFATTMKRVLEADLSKPILIYRGYVMDGKHRLTKALYLGKKTIKAKILKELPCSVKL